MSSIIQRQKIMGQAIGDEVDGQNGKLPGRIQTAMTTTTTTTTTTATTIMIFNNNNNNNNRSERIFTVVKLLKSYLKAVTNKAQNPLPPP